MSDGRGSVYKRMTVDGRPRWAWSYTTGNREVRDRETHEIVTPSTRRTHTRGGYPTKGAATKALTEAVAALGRGDQRPLHKPKATPTGEYLQAWLAGLPLERPGTRRAYRTVVDVWTKPIHKVPLRDLGPDDLLDLYAAMRESGSRTGKPLSTRSVQLTATVLGMALRDAVEAGDLAYNPADRIPKRQRPKHKARKHADRYWTPEQAATFLEATRESRWYPLWALALDTGARRGELSALRWSELDLDAGTVTVKASRTTIAEDPDEVGPTKTGEERTIDLGPRTVAALRAHWRQQTADKLAAGPGWAGGKPGHDGFVFLNEAGESPRPDQLARRFREAQQAADVPPLVFHGMRHTSATVALSAGASLVAVSERLGHANPSITLDIYAHALPKDGAAAARIIGAAIYGAEVGS